MSKKRRKSTSCYNCHTPLDRSENFCHSCGQENHSRQASTRVLISDFLADYLAFDSKLFRSVIPLVSKPGFITKEYLGGKRQQFIAPIRVFLFLSFVYFGLSFLLDTNPESSSITFNSNEASNQTIQKISESFTSNFNLMVFFFTPVLALVIMLFYRTKEKRYYVNFFVFSLHFLSFLFILGSFITVIFAGLEWVNPSETISTLGNFITFASVLYVCVYSIISLKKVFAKKNNILLFFITLIVAVFVFIIFILLYIFIIAWAYGGFEARF
jgi:hypothetical protein